MPKVKCYACVHESKGKCIKKKASMNINKFRRCGMFEVAPEKVKVKRIHKSTLRPDAIYMSKKERKIAMAMSYANALGETNSTPDCLADFREDE